VSGGFFSYNKKKRKKNMKNDSAAGDKSPASKHQLHGGSCSLPLKKKEKIIIITIRPVISSNIYTHANFLSTLVILAVSPPFIISQKLQTLYCSYILVLFLFFGRGSGFLRAFGSE
jgi:hypothetical protein